MWTLRCQVQSESGSRSRVGAHIFLSAEDNFPVLNGPMLIITQIMKDILTSAAEVRTVTLFLTAKEMVALQNTLGEMGWKQPLPPYSVTTPQQWDTPTRQLFPKNQNLGICD